MTYLGIDLHTRNMTICAVSSNGKKIGEWKLTNHTDQLDELMQEINGPLKAVVEATSSWYWLADWAQSRDIELILAHDKMLKAIAYAKVKTDSVDAHTMAQLLAADSGGKRRHKSRNKDGNKYLKVAFSQAAIGAVSFYPPVRAFYNKIRRRSGKHVARTVVAKELARIVYFMLSRNEPYKGFKGKPMPKDTYLNWPHSVSPHSLRGRDRAG